jgi:hypothetical protein
VLNIALVATGRTLRYSVVDVTLSATLYFCLRSIQLRLLLTIAIAVMATFTVSAADLTGTWKGSMNTQGGDVTVTLTIKPGPALTGTIQAGEYEAPIVNGKISGDKISFEMRIGPGTVTYDGTISGDEIRFDVVGTQGDKYALICTRQNAKG